MQESSSAASITAARDDMSEVSKGLGLPPFKRPLIPGTQRRMQDDHLGSLFATYVWFDYFGRRLTREEFQGIMRKNVFGDQYTADHRMLKRLEDPSDPMTIACEAVAAEKKLIWTRRVGCWFLQLRQENPVAKARAKDLMGL